MATIEELTPGFLTAAFGGPRVTAVESTQVGTGQMGRCYRLELEFDGDAGDLPTRMLAKLPSTDDGSRAFATAMQAYAREVDFYRLVAPHVDVRTPHCYSADVSADGGDFHLILEDLSPATECGQIEGCDAERAEAVLREAATLHAQSWQNAHMQGLDFLRTGLAVWQQIGAGAAAASQAFVARYGDRLDPVAVEIAERLGRGGADEWIEGLKEPRCLWHCDLRLDNVLFDGRAGEVPVALVDWQSVTMAPGPIDASYFVGSGLDMEARRNAEDGLVRGYHAALLEGGVRDYSWERCWEEYRANAVAGFFVSMIASISVEQTERGDQMFTVLSNRHAQHMADHDTLGLIATAYASR